MCAYIAVCVPRFVLWGISNTTHPLCHNGSMTTLALDAWLVITIVRSMPSTSGTSLGREGNIFLNEEWLRIVCAAILYQLVELEITLCIVV